MVSNDELKEIDINCTCYYFDDKTRIADIDFREINILLNKKS